MDYEKLRTYLQARIMSTTLEWNKQQEFYAVKPDDLAPAAGKMWDMFMNSVKLGELSSTQTKLLREGLEELIGKKFPDTTPRTMPNIPPFVCLTANKGNYIRGVGEGRPILHKLSGPWVDEKGEQRTITDFQSNYARLPTVEDIDAILAPIPGDKLPKIFYALLDLKHNDESLKEILKRIAKENKAFIKSKPAKPEMSDKEFRMYLLTSSGNINHDTICLTWLATDLEYSEEKEKSVQEYATSKPVPPVASCFKYKGAPALFLNAAAYHDGKELKAVSNLTWEDITDMTADEIKAFVQTIPAGICLDWVSDATRDLMLEEVKLE